MECTRGAFGKLAGQPDFIVAPGSSREVLALDRWLRDGMQQLPRDLGPQWEQWYDHGLYHRFVFRPDNCEHTLVGVVRAAMDRALRRFPFALFAIAPLRAGDASPLWLPGQSNRFFQGLEDEIGLLARCLEMKEVRARLNEPVLIEPPSSLSRERYSVFIDEVACGELDEGAGMAGVLSEVYAALVDNAFSPRTMPVALELPLTQPLYARALEVRFWIELCLALTRVYPLSLSLFWPVKDTVYRRSSLLVSFRQPPGPLLGAMLRPDETALPPAVWRPGLDGAFPGARGRRPLPVPLYEPLRVLLEHLCPGYPDACAWNRPIQERTC